MKLILRTSSTRPPKKPFLLQDERGLSTVEYVILMAVVVIGAIGTWNTVGANFKTKLNAASTNLGTLE